MLTLGATCAHAESIYCEFAIRAADSGALRGYSDKIIAQSLCVTARGAADAANANDTRKLAYCLTATRHLLREFERRFPGRDSRSAHGKC